jgi:hypothetical protein
MSGPTNRPQLVWPINPGQDILQIQSEGSGKVAAGNVQAPAKSTGTGPTTPGTIVNWLEVDLGGTKYWVPMAQ